MKPTVKSDTLIDNLIGRKLVWLLQSQAVSAGVILAEFGEAFYLDLIAYLDDLRYIQVGLYDLQPYTGNTTALKAAELSQEDYTLADIEGKLITAIQQNDLGLYILFENDLALINESAPGGNYPLILHKDEIRDQH